MLDVLKKHDVKATFFVVGNYLTSSPEIIKRMAAEGHIIANHTYSHPDMSQIASEENFRKELEKAETEYEKITGQKMKKFYRPPQGKFSEENLKMAKQYDHDSEFYTKQYDSFVETFEARK